MGPCRERGADRAERQHRAAPGLVFFAIKPELKPLQPSSFELPSLPAESPPSVGGGPHSSARRRCLGSVLVARLVRFWYGFGVGRTARDGAGLAGLWALRAVPACSAADPHRPAPVPVPERHRGLPAHPARPQKHRGRGCSPTGVLIPRCFGVGVVRAGARMRGGGPGVRPGPSVSIQPFWKPLKLPGRERRESPKGPDPPFPAQPHPALILTPRPSGASAAH